MNLKYLLPGLLCLITFQVWATNYSRSLQEVALPEITLINQDGLSINIEQVLNSSEQPVMLQFIYTSCTTSCPIISHIFAGANQQLNGKAKLVSISIDPQHDRPAMLKQHASQYAAAENWQFYTGNVADIVKLQKAFKVYQSNKMRHQVINFISTPGSGQQWLTLNGFISAKNLIAELQQLTDSQ